MPSKDSVLRTIRCTTEYEEMAYKYGAKYVCGIDECARGNWAGSTIAAACILPRELPDTLNGKLRDSKLLSPRKRAALAEEIKKCAVSWHVAEVSVEVIDSTNISSAAVLAMEEAVHGLSVVPDFLLIDAVTIDLPVEQLAIEHGDAKSVSIAAASILAKTYHTGLMERYEIEFPGYGFAKHKGYGTREHIAAIERLGLAPIHRRSFAPIREFAAAAISPFQDRNEPIILASAHEATEANPGELSLCPE